MQCMNHRQVAQKIVAAALLAAMSLPVQAGMLKKLAAAAAGATGAVALFNHQKAQAKSAAGFELAGRVVHMDDGDTLILLTPGNVQERIRLASIDAPEMPHGKKRPGQPFSRAAKETLGRLLADASAVTASCPERDRYGRAVCTVFAGKVDVNYEMVARGMAWANTARPEYIRDPRIPAAQAAAQTARRGLWAQPGQVPPWEWRKVCWEDARCSGAGD